MHDYTKMDIASLRTFAESGDAAAQYELGLRSVQDGTGLPRSWSDAYFWWEMSAEKGNVDAAYELGMRYSDAFNFKFDIEKAIHYFQFAAERGHVEAQYELGMCYNGNYALIKRDELVMEKWWLKAAEQGCVEAEYHLWGFYRRRKNFEESVKWLLKAVEQGHSDALYELGKLYFDGDCVEKDRDKARSLWQKAVSLGNRSALRALKDHPSRFWEKLL